MYIMNLKLCVLVLYLRWPQTNSESTCPTLVQYCPDKWRAIGTYLDIPAAQLSVIDELHRGDPQKCLMSMLTEQWLPRVSPPPTWQDLAEAVEFVGYPDVAQRLRQKFCKSCLFLFWRPFV